MKLRIAPALAVLFAACGGNVEMNPDAGDGSDAADLVDAVAAIDAQPPAPSIADALDCGTPASAGGMQPGTDLQRVDVDLAAFPDARCNDGTPAVFYFRPAANAANASRWVIQLQGGGACRTPDACAKRWCSVETNFGETQMTSTLAPAGGTVADGILDRAAAANPIGDYNQVFVRYCSSDGWAGRSGPLDVDALHPVSGEPVRFRIDFRGQDILDAVLATLRRDGAAPPDYTLGGAPAVLTDLDAATTVVLAGASAGGNGVVSNADRVGDVLRATNLCGADCVLDYVALIDSAFGPDASALDWTTSTACLEDGACTFADVLASAGELYPSNGDESCDTWHAAFAPDTAYLCDDPGHAIRNHVVTPFMVRMGLLDQLIGGNAIASGVSVPGRGAMTAALFAELVHDQLVDLATLPSTAEEGAAMTRAPSAFGPPCPDHETLSTNESVFGVTVVANGGPRTMFEVFTNWRNAVAPQRAVWDQGDPIDCGAP
jgi:hypothetical protein